MFMPVSPCNILTQGCVSAVYFSSSHAGLNLYFLPFLIRWLLFFVLFCFLYFTNAGIFYFVPFNHVQLFTIQWLQLSFFAVIFLQSQLELQYNGTFTLTKGIAVHLHKWRKAGAEDWSRTYKYSRDSFLLSVSWQ